MIRIWAVLTASLIAWASPAWPEETDRIVARNTEGAASSVRSLGPSPGGCDRVLFNANSIFFRASTFCGRDYLDTPEGYVALEGARRCRKLMTADETLRQVKAAMLSFDRLAREHDISLACTMADGLVRAIRERMH